MKIQTNSEMGSLDLDVSILAGKAVFVEGTVSSGKTILGWKLAEEIKNSGIDVLFFEEAHDKEMLKLFLEDKKKYAFEFQIDTHRRRDKIIRENSAKLAQGYCLIFDRGPSGDYVFAALNHEEGNISTPDFVKYIQEVLAHGNHNFKSTNEVTVFLDMSPKRASERCSDRGSVDASSYSSTYMEGLEKWYNSYITNVSRKIMIHENDPVINFGVDNVEGVKNLVWRMVEYFKQY